MTLTFVETRVFARAAAVLMPGDELRALQLSLLARPRAGSVIRGLRGIRKLRWARFGRGKRGGVRVLYFFDESAERIYLLLAYAKGAQDELTSTQRTALLTVLNSL